MAEIIFSFKELRAYQEAGVRGRGTGVRGQWSGVRGRGRSSKARKVNE